ncbi:right-handed parallel beta-helix repeat-containing protein [Lysobacter fragariae]
MAACADEFAPEAGGLAPSGLQPSTREPCPSDRPGKTDIPIAATAAPDATIYYVRTDGGDATQCTGRADAAYSGSGIAQACAWKNPDIALPPSGPARIGGGDTLLIGAGAYEIGSDGYMQPIPSGPSTSMPTRFLGKTGTRLVGVAGVHRVLNLEGSSNVEIGNLEVTDDSDCVYKHSDQTVACNDAAQWARVGLYAHRSSNVWLHDLNIHGMAARGMNAGGLNNWTMERIKLNRNGTAGWDGNVGDDGSNSGRIVLRDIEIAWNGCGERVATGEPWACWAQQSGGYGDGLGTTDTGGQWLIEDAYVHHNTSDGLDLRYMDGADATNVTLRRIHAVANAGNQVKVKGNALIESSVLVGHCSFFKGKYDMLEGDLCRGDGSTLQLVMTGHDTAIVRNNTLVGEGATQIGHSEGDSTDRIYIQNNVVIGFPYYLGPGSQSMFDGGKAKAARHFSGNLAWNTRSCPANTTCNQNPKLTGMALDRFDAEPLAGSPVIGTAVATSCAGLDFRRRSRPATNADVGAIQAKRP